MTWLDMILAGILIVSTAAGFMKGFFRLGIGLAATVLAFLLAGWFYADASAWAIPYTSSKGVANFVGYLIVFFSIMIAGALLGRLMAKLFKWIGLSWLDRAGGGKACCTGDREWKLYNGQQASQSDPGCGGRPGARLWSPA